MTKIESPNLKFLLRGVLIFTLFFSAITPLFERDTSIDATNAEPSFKMNLSVHPLVAIKSSVSISKLVPVPYFQVLFVIFSFTLFLHKVHLQKLLSHSVFLFLKQLFLFPIIFTSIFVSQASK